MKKTRWILISILGIVLVQGSTAINSSQEVTRGTIVFPEERTQEPGTPRTPAPREDTFDFISGEMSFDGKVVKGAPYSAQAVTEVIQTLSDGNRIVNKSTASLYRDSAGRTRREQSLRTIGPFATVSDPPQTIFINDPVAQMSYVLDARTHTARKMPSYRFEVTVSPPAEAGKTPSSSLAKTPPAETGEGNGNVYVRTTPPGANAR
jgi:hypothetical protein